MKFPTRHPSLNSLWSALLLEELWRLGVRCFCIAPGSRSAPLTLVAAQQEKFRKYVHFDERGLGFFALGLAKSSGNPVAVITTSGTAVANLYPAIIEARQSGVPLVIITADRPPELIDCGANQAIEQQGIYAGYPGATLNLPTPTDAIPSSWLLTSIDQSFARSCLQGLPLHINCMFREPLYPEGRNEDFSLYLSPVCRWIESETPHTVYESRQDGEVHQNPVPWHEFANGKGLVVAGRLDAEEDVGAIVQLAETLGWPLIADIQSQLHGHPGTLSYADLILSNAEGRDLLRQADRVIQVGGHLISKRLDRFLSNGQWQHYYMLGREFRRMDTGHCQTYRMVGPAGKTCRFLADQVSPLDNSEKLSSWCKSLTALSSKVSKVVNQAIDDDGLLTECWLGARLTGHLPESSSLFLANSLPVRLLDLFSQASGPRVFTNRGASGIDGLLATAAGCAEASSEPMLAVIGDLSFLHDLNSLQLVKKVQTPLVILLINNDGGGIFNLLPLTHSEEQAAEYFTTPHGLDAVHAAAMFGIPYHCPDSRSAFTGVLAEALQRGGCSLIEVKTASGEAAAQISRTLRLVEELQ